MPLRLPTPPLGKPRLGQSLAVLVAGLALVAWRTWRLWQRAGGAPAPRPAPQPDPASWPRRPRLSVLVAAWDEADLIAAHLRSFAALSYPERELLLCAGGADGTLEIARRHAGPNVTVIEQLPGEGKQRALRRCLERASGELIVLTDADCLYEDAWLSRLIAPLARGEALVATGVSEPTEPQRALALVQYQWFNDALWAAQLPAEVDGVLGRNCALRREVLERLGALDEPVRTGTDYYLSRRLTAAGYRIRAVPDSRVPTEYPDTPAAYLRMWRRWNKNLLIHGLRFRAWRDLRGVLGACGIYGLTLGLPLLTPLLGPIAAVGGALLFALAGANRLRRLAAGARAAGQPLPWRCLAGLPLYTALDMLAALLALRDALHPRLRGRW